MNKFYIIAFITTAVLAQTITTTVGTIKDYKAACKWDTDCNNLESYCCAASS